MWGRRVLNPKAVVKANVPTLVSAKQESTRKVTATLSAAVESVTRDDVVITRNDGEDVIQIKTVSLDAAKTAISIETYTDMTDGKDYTVTYTYKAQDGTVTASKQSFTATDGKISDFQLTPATIPYNKLTTIKYSALDAKGVVLYEKAINDKGDNITIDVTVENGYQDNDKLILFAQGDTAKVNVTYHTYEYNTDGTEKGLVTRDFTVTAVDRNSAISDAKFTIVKDATASPAWDATDFKVNSRLAMNDEGRVARFQLKNSSGADITDDYGDYTVESSDANVLLASGDVRTGAVLVPVKAGTAYLILRDNNNATLSQTFLVTVVKERELATLTLDKSAVSIANNTSVDTVGNVSIGFSAKDQYGDDIKVTVADPTCKLDPAGLTADSGEADTKATAKGTITISTNNTKSGNYVFSVNAVAGEITRTKTFTVNVKVPDGKNKAYELLFMNDNEGGNTAGEKALSSSQGLNTTVSTETAATGSAITMNLVKRDDGVISGIGISEVTVTSITIKGSNGKVYGSANVNDTTFAKSVSSAAVTKTAIEAFVNSKTLPTITAISYDKDTKTYTKNLAKGIYTVSLTYTKDNKEKTITGNFRITDDQPTLSANVLKTTSDEGDINSVLKNPDYVKYVYGGITQGTDNYPIDVPTVFGKVSNNRKTVVVSKALVTVKLGDNHFVNIETPINRVFTTTGGWTDIEENK